MEFRIKAWAMTAMLLLVMLSSSVQAGAKEAVRTAVVNELIELYPKLDEKKRKEKAEGQATLILDWVNGALPNALAIVKSLKQLKSASPATRHPGAGVMILIDTSGSMDSVPKNDSTKKIIAAMNAARRALAKLKVFAAKHPERKISVGVSQFSSSVAEVIKLQPIGAKYPALSQLKATGGTAIGDALLAAKGELDRAQIKSQHIILITDGENVHGAPPLQVIRAFNLLSMQEFPILHFIAFDISKEKFAAVEKDFIKKIHEAADGAQLDRILATLLQDEILAEQR